jgi:hypothetical protein
VVHVLGDETYKGKTILLYFFSYIRK